MIGVLLSVVMMVGCSGEEGELVSPDAGALMFVANPMLSTDPLVANGSGTITVTGAFAFEDVAFVASGSAGVGPCPAVLGGSTCLGVSNPKVLGIAQANGLGEATFVMNVPGGLGVGDGVALQAAIVRGINGVDSVVSNVLSTVVVAGNGTDADGDGYDVSVDCDDADPLVFPGALEICDGVDNDCDAATHEDGVITVDASLNYNTLSDAAAFSTPGSVIHACPGTYTEDFYLTDLDLIGVGSPGSVVLDGSATVTSTLGSIGDNLVQNITIRNAAGERAVLVSSGTLTLDAVVVTQSNVSDETLWILDGATLEMTDSVVSNNVAGDAGGAMVWGTLNAVGTAFVDNADTTFQTSLSVYFPEITLTDCVVEGSQGGDAALVLSDNANVSVTVTTSDFGAGADENLPADVHVVNSNDTITTYQANASFTCDNDGCQ